MKHLNNPLPRKGKKHNTLRLLALMAMLLTAPIAYGQTEWNGEASGTFVVTKDYSRNSDCDIAKGTSLTLNVTGNNLTLQVARFKLEDGDASTAGGELNINIIGNNVTFDFVQILINGTANINNGAKVSIINNGTNFKITKRGGNMTALSNGYIPLFRVHPYGSLEIKGISEDKKVTIDGGWTMDDKGIPTNEPGFQFGFGVLYTTNGKVTFENILIRNFVSYLRGYNANTNQGEGCLLRFNGGSPSTEGKHSFKNVEITKCYAGPTNLELNNGYSYGRIIGMYSGIHDITFEKVHIHHCFVHEPENSNAGIFGMGGIIRSQGSMGGTLKMKNCTINDNRYMNRRYFMSSPPAGVTDSLAGQGGAINWRSGLLDDDYPQHKAKIIIENSKFYNNMAKQGGAIATNGALDLSTNVEIYNNFAAHGGGVYFWTYNGMQDTYDGRGFDAIFGSGVNIHHNEAKEYGGGSYVGIEASNDVGFKAILSGTWNPATDTVNPLFRVKINTGATIQNNKAPKGAGIAIRDAAPYRHKNTQEKLTGNSSVDNPAYNEWSGIYERQVIVAGGTVCNNTAQGTAGTEMAGAGIYIEKYPYPSDHAFYPDYGYSDEDGGSDVYGAGTLTVDAESGLIYGNTAINGSTTGLGGGMYIASNFTDNTIVSTLNVNIGKAGKDLQIYNNQAYTDGGGVYVLYDRTDGRKNQGTVTVKNGTIGKTDLATGNKALNGNGGGICVLGGTVHVEGGNVEYNTANQLGGGVYVKVPNVESNTIIRGGANISRNTAKGGGGVYVDQGTLQVIGDTWNSGAGAWQLLPWATGTYNPAAEATHTRITNNSATDGNGGGIDAGHGEVDLTNTLIYNNTASGTGENKGRGGGVYLNDGTIVITDSKILNNTAENNGGGIDDHLGDIDIYGGDISHNTAINGNGGGIYTNEGDILVWPTAMKNNTEAQISQCELTKTTVSNNKAGGNGGGLNTHIGRFDVRFAKITENIAGYNYSTIGNGGGNGGGLFCNGPHVDPTGYTVRLLHCDLEENKACGNVNEGDNITGRGGGVYLKYGSIFAEHCEIVLNEADINGGGLDNHEGELRVYGSFIDENVAKTGRGGGLYTEHGNIVVGPCDTYGYPSSKASRIVKNKAKINGGGINNHHGDIVIHGDRINENIAEEGDGGGVYIHTGNIYMYGGQINNNKADKGKGGGVYGGAGKFNIMERKANPIVEIMEVEDITTDGFNVHYHLVDRGLVPITVTGDGPDYTYSDPGTLTHGIAYATSEAPWADSVPVEYASGTHEYVLSEGCVRIPVEGLTPGQTYYIIAWAKYSQGGVDYYDASPVLKITAPSKGAKALQGPRSVYPAVEENPFFMELTPLQQAILSVTPDTTAAAPRQSRDGDDEAPVDIPQINNNTAMYGGGICIDQQNAELVFSGRRSAVEEGDLIGQINLNYASEAGGGIYIGRESADEFAKMQMMGKCEVNRNRVPAGKLGGGIYLDGRFYVGDKDTDTQGTHGLKVDKNFAIDKDQATFESDLAAIIAGTASQAVIDQYNKKTMNNVFLPRNEYDYEEHGDDATTSIYNKVSVITLLSDISGYSDVDQTKPYSHIGFSVVNGFCPVIATAEEFGGDYKTHLYTGGDAEHGSEAWLFNLMKMAGDDGASAEIMKGAVFEDSESYVAIHTRGDLPPFREKYIYLWGCWTHPVVMDDPEVNKPMKGSDYPEDPTRDPQWLGHYVITNPDANTEDGSGEALCWEIYSPEGLSWFTSYVNGLNDFDEKTGNADGDNHYAWKRAKNPKANAKIMNDLDMSAYLWVPIGSVQKFYLTALASDDESSLFVDSETQVLNGSDPDSEYTKDAHYYQGTFDGQGHIIKGLQGLYLTGIRKFGLFGYLAEGAVVKNTFVDEGLFVSDDRTVVYSAGGIAGEMKTGSLSNSEARMNFNTTYCDDNTLVGGLVGDMLAGSIHSCMAMPTITGSTSTQLIGGLVGEMHSGTTLKNSFSNVLFTNSTLSYRVGGIVGKNNGVIANVYVRYNNETNTPNLGNDIFYWIAGNNEAAATNVTYCFSPDGKTGTGSGEWKYADGTEPQLRRTYEPTNLVTDKYGFAHQDQNVAAYDGDAETYIENGEMDEKGNLKGLLAALNNWVSDNPDHSMWTRTMASKINDDYPVLMFADFNVVGTEDGVYMKYDDNVNDMWKEPNHESLAPADKAGKNFQSLTKEANPKAAMYLYKTNGVTTTNTSAVPINVTDNLAVPLHIEQHIGVTQATGDENLTARVGITFDNSDCSTEITFGGEAYDWHMFSSALKTAPVGITYNSENANPATGGKSYIIKNQFTALQQSGITDTDYHDRDYMDPPVITWNTDEGTVGYFPTNTPYGKWGKSGHWPSSGAYCPTNEDDNPYSFDFYSFHERSRHWINFKREGTPYFMDHWHQDIDATGKHQNLRYENESTLQRGKGYMMGVSKHSMLMADGILNNGKFTSQEPLSNSEYSFNMSGYSEDLRGINLVGNPYQSYLNFTALAQADENDGIIFSETYYLFDADAKRYLSYTAGASDNEQYAPRYIHPHQGFFIKTRGDGRVLTFKNDMRLTTGDESSYFRGQDLNYPLVNLFCYDPNGHYDLTTVEMNRPELGGGVKLKDMRFGNSLLYASMDDEDYQTLFAPEGTSVVALRFKASQNGVYTMRWGTLHGEFQHLHLIDNLAGVDVDCMKQSEYRFEATTTDYLSRFKLVFDVTGVDENLTETENATFAFLMGDEIVVNGSGDLSVFDIQGRCIANQRLSGSQSSVSLPRAASGMYILRLTSDRQVKTQKLIIK